MAIGANENGAFFGLLLGITAHTIGWPFPRGAAHRIADALASYLRSLGGEIITGRRIESLDELPAAHQNAQDYPAHCRSITRFIK
jgi:phytoene dehydrogenase-like protein